IAHVRNIVRACTLLKQGIWRDEFYFYEECGFELENKVLGIVGFGKVGREVAKRAKALQMRILAYDPYVSPNLMKSLGVEPTTLERLLEESDVVTLHVRLTDETRHMIGERELKRMKPTAILVNTSRGEIVDEKALIKALNEGWIAGAALDVFEKEPLPPDHPFLKMDNVTITPHIAGASKEVVKRSVIMIAEDVKRLLKGEKPLYCVNPEVLEKEKAK
ncbi:MAG: D-glycerate dehydrogenase, partial [Thaumarchaeota archaeon]